MPISTSYHTFLPLSPTGHINYTLHNVQKHQNMECSSLCIKIEVSYIGFLTILFELTIKKKKIILS